MKCTRMGWLLTTISALLLVAPFGCDSNPGGPAVPSASSGASGGDGGGSAAAGGVAKVGPGRGRNAKTGAPSTPNTNMAP